MGSKSTLERRRNQKCWHHKGRERETASTCQGASQNRYFKALSSHFLQFSTDEKTPSRPSTPKNKLLLPNSRPGTPNSSRLALSTHALHPKQPVQTPQQFYDWFALIDRSVAHSQEAHFRAHVASVSEHLDTCDKLIEHVDEIDKEVDGMLEGWRGVEEGGKSLKDACERLLEERVSDANLVWLW